MKLVDRDLDDSIILGIRARRLEIDRSERFAEDEVVKHAKMVLSGCR